MPYDDPNAKAVAFIGAIGTVLLIMVVVLLQAFFYHAQRAEDERKAAVTSPAELRALQAEQRAQLAGYRWLDREKGVVAIPIEDAMRLEAERLNAGRAAR